MMGSNKIFKNELERLMAKQLNQFNNEHMDPVLHKLLYKDTIWYVIDNCIQPSRYYTSVVLPQGYAAFAILHGDSRQGINEQVSIRFVRFNSDRSGYTVIKSSSEMPKALINEGINCFNNCVRSEKEMKAFFKKCRDLLLNDNNNKRFR